MVMIQPTHDENYDQKYPAITIGFVRPDAERQGNVLTNLLRKILK